MSWVAPRLLDRRFLVSGFLVDAINELLDRHMCPRKGSILLSWIKFN